MSLEAPPTLLELAGQSLLREETLVICALKDLPRELFPPLFKEAFTSRRTNILRSMVTVWPFPCLPLGSLMKTPDLETLKAVLSGLDYLLTVNIRPRRCKLQVLDLRDVHKNFWTISSEVEDGLSSPQVTSQKQTLEDHPASGERQPLTVLTEFCLKFPYLEDHEEYLLHWARQRKGSIQLCCKKIEAWPLAIHSLLEVLDIVKLDSVQNLELNSWWKKRKMAWFTSYQGQMNYLYKLLPLHIYNSLKSFKAPSLPLGSACVDQLISQFSQFSCLQHLYMNGVHFLWDNLEQMLRGLKTPLETLTINHCLLSKSDWNHLSLCPSVGQLKHLDLSGVEFFFCPPDSLHILLDRVTGTLETLDLEGCEMEDHHFSVLLPVLSRCSKLTRINFYDNDISLPVLKDLLYHTASLSQLTLEMYPAPMECYVDGPLDRERFGAICPQLMDTVRAVREPKTVSFASIQCPRCEKRCVYNLGISLCLCWEE